MKYSIYYIPYEEKIYCQSSEIEILLVRDGASLRWNSKPNYIGNLCTTRELLRIIRCIYKFYF